jgi:hypothetical protein
MGSQAECIASRSQMSIGANGGTCSATGPNAGRVQEFVLVLLDSIAQRLSRRCIGCPPNGALCKCA